MEKQSITVHSKLIIFMPYLFTSESVSEGHPDKIADQISDALVDHFLAFDPQSKVACETLVTTGQVVLAGEVKSNTYLDLHKIARDVINRIGYNKSEYMFEAHSCGILSSIHEQSSDINQGVERESKEEQGAGDQGMMFGYATNETDNYMPLPLDLAHMILIELSAIRKEGKLMTYLRPDAKSQVTIEYSDDNKPLRIDSIVISTQHDEFILPKNGKEDARLVAQKSMQNKIKEDVINLVLPRVIKKLKPALRKLFTGSIKYHINPTGNFVIGGPHGDTGLTGRKIIVDTYGGKGAHGGGAFSGKDPSKVDRSGAYATRHIAKNLVAAGVCDEVLVQVSYAIGIPEPTNIYVNTYGTAHVKMTDAQIAEKVKTIFPMRPYEIESRLKLRKPIYSETASYGHMGRTPEIKESTFYDGSGRARKVKFETFTWEKLDKVQDVRKAFKLK
jgi:S-adenosylmethionine synthetase